MKKIVTCSAEETKGLGEKLGSSLFSGAIVSLTGELGSGKTCFVQGIARGLKVKESNYVTSPSFVLVKEYQGRLPLYHLDFYRLELKEIEDLALEEYFYKDGVTVMEWGEKVKELLPETYLEINFKIIEENKPGTKSLVRGKREIKLIAHGKIYEEVIQKLAPKTCTPGVQGNG